MTKPSIYGTAGSRAVRSIWLAEELVAEIGFDYDQIQSRHLVRLVTVPHAQNRDLVARRSSRLVQTSDNS